jgi:hypothetical protein
MIDPNIACAAIDAGKCLAIRYGGFDRTVEVHAVGRSKNGHWLMRIWQVAGRSRSGAMPPWRLMRLDETSNAVITDVVSDAPRPGYKKSDEAMRGGIKRQL